MVKAGGRSKRNNANGSNGSNASSAFSSASSSSPPRRLKKGGKRRRRLCYNEGCTLCPSFGYKGHVAVSCSRHKEAGMRNLTARRCQHMGCLTAANFGIPGDKPRFCLAHSTEGMVNRNKPRGREGMVMTVSRKSRRTTKATSSVYDGNNGMLEAAAAADARASKGSAGVGNCSVSGGKGILMSAVRARSGDVSLNWEDPCEPLSPRTSTNARSQGSGRSAVTVGDAGASVVNGSPVPSMALMSRGHRSNGVMSHEHSLSSMPVWIPMAPSESGSGSRSLCRTVLAMSVSQGKGPDGLSAGGPGEKPPVGIVSVASGRNEGRVPFGNVDKDLGLAKIPRVPSLHDEFIVAPRVETDDFEKHLPSNERNVLGGDLDRRGDENALFDFSFARDFENSGDIMNGGDPSFFMDGLNSLGNGDRVDSDMGFHIGATLEDILEVERDDVKTFVFDSKGSHEREPLLGKCSDPSAMANSGLPSSANGSAMRSSAGLSLNGLSPTVDSVISVGGIRSGVGFSSDSCRITGGDGSGGMNSDGACLSPPQKRHQDSLGDNNQHASLPTHLGSTPLENRSMNHGDTGPVPSGNFSSPSSFHHSTASSAPLQAGFGLAIVPNSGRSMTIAITLTPAGQINMGVGVGIDGGMPRAATGVVGVLRQGDGGSIGLGNRRMASGNSLSLSGS